MAGQVAKWAGGQSSKHGTDLVCYLKPSCMTGYSTVEHGNKKVQGRLFTPSFSWSFSLATYSCIDILVAILGWLVTHMDQCDTVALSWMKIPNLRGPKVVHWHWHWSLRKLRGATSYLHWHWSYEKRQQEGTAWPHLASSRSLFIAQKGSHSLTHSPPSLDSRQTLESEEEEELWMETSTTRWAGRGLVMQWSSTIWTESKFQPKGGNFYKEALIWSILFPGTFPAWRQCCRK